MTSGFIRNSGGAPLDRRYQLAGDYEPASDNIAELVYKNGALLSKPVIMSGSNVVTSTGATGTYAINFPTVAFSGAPIVVAWCSKESGGSVAVIELDATATTLFQFDLFLLSGGAITAGHTVTVQWIAIGV